MDLEQRAGILEVEVANMETKIDEVETDLNQQEGRITVVEENVFDNTAIIAGNNYNNSCIIFVKEIWTSKIPRKL